MPDPLPLHGLHESLGARFGELAGRLVPRNYGDPAAEYEAARAGAALVDRSERLLVRLHGRDPLKMIQGLVTNDVAGAPEGRAVYAAVLTPKGRMLADVRIFRRPGDLLLDADPGAGPGLLAHLKKFLPPLFARFEDVSAAHGVLAVHGPRSRAVVESALAAELPEDAEEDACVVVAFQGMEVLAASTRYAGPVGWDLFASAEALEPLWRALSAAGARPLGHGTLEVLRIEVGRPRWGAELDETVIPLEAGLLRRAISTSKGCYTGQEVIIRILHRGHVNRVLRGLLLGESPAPARDTPLTRPGDSRPIGRITSACYSPRLGQTVALAYVRREVTTPAPVRLGDAEGPEGLVVELPFDDTL